MQRKIKRRIQLGILLAMRLEIQLEMQLETQANTQLGILVPELLRMLRSMLREAELRLRRESAVARYRMAMVAAGVGHDPVRKAGTVPGREDSAAIRCSPRFPVLSPHEAAGSRR